MADWDKVNRLELELAQAKVTLDKVTAQRDLARSAAALLEAELAQAGVGNALHEVEAGTDGGAS